MKNMFKEAHEMAKEIKREYPEVDYRTQFGLCLAYLHKSEEAETVEFIKKEENTRDYDQETGMLILTTSGRQKAWVAEIKGLDDKYGFKRDFREHDEIENQFVSYRLDNNIIYNWCQSRRQYYGIVKNGKLYEISKQDVENLIAQ